MSTKRFIAFCAFLLMSILPGKAISQSWLLITYDVPSDITLFVDKNSIQIKNNIVYIDSKFEFKKDNISSLATESFNCDTRESSKISMSFLDKGRLINIPVTDKQWAYVPKNTSFSQIFDYACAQKNIQDKIISDSKSNLQKDEPQEQLRLSQQQQTTTPTVSVPSIGRRVALVVGNANYKVRPLKNPRNDADDISRSLRSSGFEVIDLRDASLQQMRNGVRQFGDRLINNDVGLVYFSGHGVEVKGRNYFIPVNADIMREDEIADQGLDVSLILEKMSTAGKGVNILIVDACRDDPFGRSFRSSSRGLAQMDAPRGTIIAYATSPGKVASDGDPRERNSPYTKNLIKAMQQPNKPIEQVFKEVRRAVQEETKNQQTPWENTSLSGDFFFRVQK